MSSAPEARTPARRSLLRRALRLCGRGLLLVLAVLLLVRLTVPLWLPPLLERAGQEAGLALRYGSLDLRLLAGDLELRDLTVELLPPEGAPGEVTLAQPLLDVDYLAADLSMVALLGGELRLRRVAVGRADVWLTRDELGAWQLPATGGGGEPETPEPPGEPDESEADQAAGPADFGLPLRIDRVDLGNLALHVHDRGSERRLELEAGAELIDLGHPDEPGVLLLRARAPGLFESLRLEGDLSQARLDGTRLPGLETTQDGQLGPRALELAFRLRLVDLDPDAATHWTRGFGLGGVARELDGGLAGTARVFATDLTGGARAELELEGLAGTADGVQGAGLTGLVASYDFGGLDGRDRLGPVSLTGLHLEAGRSAEGNLFALGFELFEAAAAPLEEAVVEAAREEASAAESDATAPEADLRELLLQGLELTDSSFRFRDEQGGVDLGLEVLRVGLGPMDLVGGPGREAELVLELAAQGVFESLVLRGTVQLGGAPGTPQRISGRLDLDGLDPVGLEPLLTALGLSWELGPAHLGLAYQAELVLRADGGLELDADLLGLDLTGEQRVLGLEHLGLGGLVLSPSGDLSLEELRITGPALVAELGPEGLLQAAGLAFVGAPAGAATPGEQPAAAPSAPTTSGRLPRIQVGRVLVSGVDLDLTDASVDPPLRLAPELLELELSDVDLFGPGALMAPFRLALAQPGLVGDLVVEGTAEGSLDAEGRGSYGIGLALGARGLSTELLAGRLAAAGLSGAVVDGQLDLNLGAEVQLAPDQAPSLGLWMEQLSLTVPGEDGRTEVLGMERLALEALESGPDGLSLSELQLIAPRLRVERDASGAIGLGGLVLGAAPQPAPGAAPDQPAAAAAAAAPAAPAAPAAKARPALRLGGVDLSDGSLVLVDAGLDEPLVLGLSLLLGAADLANPAPTTLTASLGIPGRLGSAELALDLTPDVLAPSLAGSLLLAGIDGAGLADLLPPGVEVELTDGRLELGLAAGADFARPGDLALDLELVDLALREGAQAPLLSLERVAVHLSHLSDAAIGLEELALEGLDLDVRRTAAGLELAGLVLTTAPAEASAVEAPAGADAPDPDAPDPVAPAGPVVPVTSAGPAGGRPAHPVVSVGRVVLELERRGWLDTTRPEAVPLELSLLFENLEPFERDLAAEPEDGGGLEVDQLSGALRFALTGSAEPALSSARVDLVVDPFAVEPYLGVQLALAGLSGSGLLAALPELAGVLDGAAVEGGSLVGGFDAGLRLRRRGPLEFDLASGVAGDFELSGLAWRPTPESDVELGLERLAGELVTAGPDGVVLDSLELERPLGRLALEPGGLRLGGWLLPTPPEVGSSPEAPVAPEAPAVAADPVTPAKPPFPVQVRELSVSGLDLVLRDDRVEPPMVLPLDDLELLVRGLDSAATTRPLPIDFELFVGAGDIELQERHTASNVVSGLFGAVGGVLTGSDDAFEVEQRPAFAGLDLSGRLALFPAPTGWVALELGGLELTNYRGLVLDSGVDLGDGVLDLEVDLRLLGERGTSINSVARAEYLSLSEPPGGPISTYLQLPAPLDTVLFLLRDQAGQLVLPLSFRVDAGGGPEGLGQAVAKTLGLLIGDAIASSPLRIVGGVLDMTGLMGEEQLELPEQLYSVDFLAGSQEQGSWPLLAEVGPIVTLLQGDPSIQLDLTHVFSSADLDRLGALQAPDPAACRALVERLRLERDALVVRRDLAAVGLRADYALGVTTQLEASRARLLDLDAELALLEESLDGVLAYLRPGGERRAARRTRAAALLVAEQRLEIVRAALTSLPISSIGDRLRVRRARLGELAESEPGAPTGGRVLLLPRR